jgi:hypothetical protein
LGPFLTGSHLLIERGGNDGCLLNFDHGVGSGPTYGSKERVFNLNDPWRFAGGITPCPPRARSCVTLWLVCPHL